MVQAERRMEETQHPAAQEITRRVRTFVTDHGSVRHDWGNHRFDQRTIPTVPQKDQLI